MDEGTFNPVSIRESEILDVDEVYRSTLKTYRSGGELSTRAFTLSAADKVDFQMSVNWSGLSTPEECLAILGATYKMGRIENGFKDWERWDIHALNVEFLRGIAQVISVFLSPILVQPPVIGNPSNPAHASIKFNPTDWDRVEPVVASLLANHAFGRHRATDSKIVRKRVEELRNAPLAQD